MQMSFFLLDYPFDERRFPGVLEAIAHLRTLGRPVIMSDGDTVFQPRKIRRAGLWDAFQEDVLIYVHKEDMLDDMRKRYPADHYVMVDDKPRILVALKKLLGDKVTTVFVKQGHYAAAAGKELQETPPDITIDTVAQLATMSREDFLAAGVIAHRAPRDASGVDPTGESGVECASNPLHVVAFERQHIESAGAACIVADAMTATSARR